MRAQAALAQHRGDPHEAARLFERAAQAYAPSGATLWQAYSLLLATPRRRPRETPEAPSSCGDGPTVSSATAAHACCPTWP
ncbi:hypothetical protein [Streptomyces ossamyceticus]|uniref:Tetratricopeptide repeat protein n=1 Tax=Streptomyces ossamyceticus TaxID=249581 RepID=A0ABV2UWK8_9ACTN